MPFSDARSVSAKNDTDKVPNHEEESDGQHQIAERPVRNVPFVAAAKAGSEKSFQP
jgi:hypothetical protein